MISRKLTPFIGVKGGMVLEAVWEGDGDFNGTGYMMGASVGAAYRLDRRVRLEAGVGYSAVQFSDFSHTRAGRWTLCLAEQRESGLDLPHVVQTCSPVSTLGPATALDQPIVHPSSGRRDRWFGLWIGVVVPIFEPG
jgi:hypothetical protein